ncbi:MAG: DUF5723 family protein [Ignavibacteriaceae bacterium]|nr:DUF5723 family protein [Ignavibacteriaceae bacterium]
MKTIIRLIIISLGLSLQVFAQFGSVGALDSRSMSMGKTYNASTSGIYSIGINPANMMFSPQNHFEFSTVFPLPAISMRAGTNFMSFTDLNYFFGGDNGNARVLTPADKQRLADLFSNSGKVFADLSLNEFSAMYRSTPNVGAFAFSMVDYIGLSFTVPKSIVDLSLNGNQSNQIYSFNDAATKSWWIREYSLSYARELPEINQKLFDKIAAGISLKLVNGFAYVGMDHINTSLSTGASNSINGTADMTELMAFSPSFGSVYDFDSSDTKASMGPFPKAAGSGLGIDLGVSASMDQVWRFALSITDIGSIKWDQYTAQYSGSGNFTVNDLTDKTQLDSLKDKMVGKGAFNSGFTTNLPTALRAGVSYNLVNIVPGSMLLAFDYNQGFNDSPGNSKNPRFSVGVEWTPIGFFILRTGCTVGGLDGFGWGLGIGLDAGLVEFNFATSDMNQVVSGNSADMFTVAFGSRWKIN